MTHQEEALTLPSWTVIIDKSHTIWEKRGGNFYRPGSSGSYNWNALVWPIEIIYTPESRG